MSKTHTALFGSNARLAAEVDSNIFFSPASITTALAMTYGISLGLLKKLVAPLENRPIIRCTSAGLLLGLLGMVLPLSLFLGSNSLVFVTENGAALGVGLVIVLVFAKIVATAGAISSGFIGGPIFPLLFAGGAAGTAVHLIFPTIPLALSVACTMAALTAAALPAPFAARIGPNRAAICAG